MNIDTDTQWAFWDGVRKYEATNRDYLARDKLVILKVKINQIKRNTIHEFGYEKEKNQWLERLQNAFEDLNCIEQK